MGDADDILDSLREALTVSPENLPIRRQLATMLLSRGRADEAERLIREGMEKAPQSEQLKLVLARCFVQQGKHSAAMVIAEELVARPGAAPAVHLLLAKLLLRAGELRRAGHSYGRAVEADPSLADADLAEAVGHAAEAGGGGGDLPFDEGEEDDDVDEEGRVRLRSDGGESKPFGADMEKPKIDFDDVGGMEPLKEQIRLKIIEPLRNVELYKAYGKAVGGGILMYGPPGCGKTHLARATAGQVDAAFIPIGIHDVLDMYIGESEKRLHAIFEQAREHRPCVLFFDEVDALGARRSDLRESSSRRMINQFLGELDGVESSNDGVLILAATNAPWHLDSAFRRPGRFDRVIFVPPPDKAGRAAILRVLLKDKPQADVDAEAVAAKTDAFSGADLKAVVDRAVEAKLDDAMRTGKPLPLTTKDLLKSAKAVKPSTKEWFATAKNYALYSNEGGAYDDVLDYLKMR